MGFGEIGLTIVIIVYYRLISWITAGGDVQIPYLVPLFLNEVVEPVLSCQRHNMTIAVKRVVKIEIEPFARTTDPTKPERATKKLNSM